MMPKNTSHENGTDHIWLSDVICKGSEYSIANCQYTIHIVRPKQKCIEPLAIQCSPPLGIICDIVSRSNNVTAIKILK